jgi:hypothetical protein
MIFEEAIHAITKRGFTVRQAQFLVLVARHSGVCVMRQYSTFAGLVFGQKTRKFFDKLVRSGFVSTYDCALQRMQLSGVVQDAAQLLPLRRSCRRNQQTNLQRGAIRCAPQGMVAALSEGSPGRIDNAGMAQAEAVAVVRALVRCRYYATFSWDPKSGTHFKDGTLDKPIDRRAAARNLKAKSFETVASLGSH